MNDILKERKRLRARYGNYLAKTLERFCGKGIDLELFHTKIMPLIEEPCIIAIKEAQSAYDSWEDKIAFVTNTAIKDAPAAYYLLTGKTVKENL